MNQEPQNEHALLGRSHFDRGALRQQSYSTDAQAVETKVARNPATQYLVINSKDRNQTSSTGNYVRQPWNQFRLQRPQALMQTYATRMLVSEINFPFYVPNVNNLNDQILIETLSDAPGTPETLFLITLNNGYYSNNSVSGVSLATALNDIMSQTPGFQNYGSIQATAGGSGNILVPPDVTANSDGSFSWNSLPGIGDQFRLFGLPSEITSEVTYYTTPSLARLMGFEWTQVNGSTTVTTGQTLSGNPTTLQYTQYIDIVSDKLHQYTTNRDGNSDNFFSRNLICRLYISDEASNIVEGVSVSGSGGTTTSTPVQFIPGVSGPFIIHRQFKNAKAVMWNKEASVDWLDIAVYDEYGNLVPLPPASTDGLTPKIPTYPDFQITLLASEN